MPCAAGVFPYQTYRSTHEPQQTQQDLDHRRRTRRDPRCARQATGVLASWNDKVFGSAVFGKAPATDGYARSVTGEVHTERVITSNSFEVTTATHTFADQGSSIVPGPGEWFTNSKSGLFSSGVVRGTGRSAAAWSRDGGNIAASAESLAKDLEIIPRSTAIDPSDRLSLMDTTGEFRAAVSCESDDHGRTVTTRAEAPSGSPIEIGIGSNNYYSVPQANQSVVIDDDAVGLHVAGTLRSIVRQEPDYAVSTLVLDIDIQSAVWPHVSFWTVSMQLVRAECGIGRSLPAVDSGTTLHASRMAMARLAPDSESASPSRSVESSSSTSSASKSTEGSESGSSGPHPRRSPRVLPRQVLPRARPPTPRWPGGADNTVGRRCGQSLPDRGERRRRPRLGDDPTGRVRCPVGGCARDGGGEDVDHDVRCRRRPTVVVCLVEGLRCDRRGSGTGCRPGVGRSVAAAARRAGARAHLRRVGDVHSPERGGQGDLEALGHSGIQVRVAGTHGARHHDDQFARAGRRDTSDE